jgi:uncharacterized protein YjbI with pentapeptide repeats
VDANLTGAKLTNVSIPYGSDFSGANLTRANFDGATTNYINVTNANLTGIDLRTAVWSAWTVSNADFADALLPSREQSVRGYYPRHIPTGWRYQSDTYFAGSILPY